MDAAIFAAHQPGFFQRLDPLVGALAGDPGEITKLFLRDLQQALGAGVQHRVEQGGQHTGDAGVDAEHALVFHHADELTQPFVQLGDHVAVEGNTVVKQPEKGGAVHECHPCFADGHHIVAARFFLEQGTFAEPAARADAGQRGGLAAGPVAGHLAQAIDDAHPVGDRFAFHADEGVGGEASFHRAGQGALERVRAQCLPPKGVAQQCFDGVQRSFPYAVSRLIIGGGVCSGDARVEARLTHAENVTVDSVWMATFRKAPVAALFRDCC